MCSLGPWRGRTPGPACPALLLVQVWLVGPPFCLLILWLGPSPPVGWLLWCCCNHYCGFESSSLWVVGAASSAGFILASRPSCCVGVSPLLSLFLPPSSAHQFVQLLILICNPLVQSLFSPWGYSCETPLAKVSPNPFCDDFLVPQNSLCSVPLDCPPAC